VNAAHKGRRAEHRARVLLEGAGFTVCRAAGSKGPVDLVAWDAVALRFVSVKSTTYASAREREALRAMPRPPGSIVEVWRFPSYCRTPLIERL